MNRMIRRSTLILPVNIPRFVEKAYQRGADAILLDLEDAVPAAEKESARKLVKDSIALASRGGAEVGVRVNKDPSWLAPDVEASVYPGLDGITLPKTESAEEVRNLEALVEKFERARGIKPGHIEFSILIESPKGLLKARGDRLGQPADRVHDHRPGRLLPGAGGGTFGGSRGDFLSPLLGGDGLQSRRRGPAPGAFGQHRRVSRPAGVREGRLPGAPTGMRGGFLHPPRPGGRAQPGLFSPPGESGVCPPRRGSVRGRG